MTVKQIRGGRGTPKSGQRGPKTGPETTNHKTNSLQVSDASERQTVTPGETHAHRKQFMLENKQLLCLLEPARQTQLNQQLSR